MKVLEAGLGNDSRPFGKRNVYWTKYIPAGRLPPVAPPPVGLTVGRIAPALVTGGRAAPTGAALARGKVAVVTPET